MPIWMIALLTLVIAVAIVWIPRYLYEIGKIDRDTWLTIMIGLMTLLTLLQVILLVLKAF